MSPAMRTVVLLLLSSLTAAHECPAAASEEEAEDWLEGEVVAGFRVWQILFLAVAGTGALVVACCCVRRCRVPRTRQEIEANHRRDMITRLFRRHLDGMPVDEVDLMWALGEVKLAAEKPAPPPAPLPTLAQRVRGLLLRRTGSQEDRLDDSSSD